MRPPRLASVIERRLLVNYRVAPEAVAPLLPAPLRPQLVRGHAVAGICLLRLGSVRPAWAPAAVGLRSENAAHRIAVEWDGPDGVETGVYIPRRDTASLVNRWAGGRVFPGEHGHADFEVRETPDTLRVAYATRDGGTRVEVTAQLADRLEGSGLFADLDEASAFFRAGSKGYSETRSGCALDGMQLATDAWRIEPGRVTSARSSYFDDPDRFPPGSATLDSVLVMRDVPVHWRALPGMPVTAPAGAALRHAA
ncbi:DUF2071 domain-containing protein [Streptomyces showdoensis]|uniref:DUF2071 domain-containing protein n=1 Tax=Streptomyces showdoensis TaxID=68268 RepID=A0A2P2GHX2_STREW|nr:DUF2071 domain-containing protein [Streptomyces showdoensis]KKZ71122.1 hypothetical protein VO63_25025 [Streptomyces showdoensis]